MPFFYGCKYFKDNMKIANQYTSRVLLSRFYIYQPFCDTYHAIFMKRNAILDIDYARKSRSLEALLFYSIICIKMSKALLKNKGKTLQKLSIFKTSIISIEAFFSKEVSRIIVLPKIEGEQSLRL